MANLLTDTRLIMNTSTTCEIVRRALSHHSAWAAITLSWIAGPRSRQQNPPRLKTMNRSSPLKRFIVASPRALVTLFLWIGLFGPGSLAMAQGHLATVAGSVTLTGADRKSFPAVGVQLILNCRSEQFPRTEVSNAGGAFRFEHVPVGACTIVTDLQGFSVATAVIEASDATRLQFRLTVEPIFAGVMVTRRAWADVRIKGHGFRGSRRSRRSVGSAEGKSGR
jgi:hypothetical protein